MSEVLLIESPDGYYQTSKPLTGNELIKATSNVLQKKFERGDEICSPESSKKFLQLALGSEDREQFGVIFLDNAHRVIAYEVLFMGSLNSSEVHPREIAKRGMEHNSPAIICCHNHPSGLPEPSPADKEITQAIISACNLLSIRVLDHIIVGGSETFSFAENGLI